MNKFSAIVHANNAEKIDALYQKFSALNQAEQTLMMILSAVYKPIGMKKLDAIVDILVNQGFLTLAKKDYRLSIARKDALLEQEILSYHREGLFLNRLLCNRLCQDMANFSGSFRVQASLPATTPDVDDMAQQNLLTILHAAEEIAPVVRSLSWQDKLMDQRRIVRDFYLLGRADKAKQALDFDKNPQVIDYDLNLILIDMLFVPFEFDSFLRLPQAMQYQAFATLIRRCQIEGQNCDYAISLLERVCAEHADINNEDYNLDCQHLLAEQYLYQLRFTEFEKIQLSQDASCYGLQLRGAHAFLSGQNQEAIDYFGLAIKAKNKFSRRKNQYLSEILGYFYKLALIIQGNKEGVAYYAQALEQIDFEERDRKSYSDFFSLGKNLRKPIESLLNGGKYNVLVKYSSAAMQLDHMGHLLDYMNYLLAQIWCNRSKEPELAALAQEYQGYFENLGYALFRHICAQLLAYFKGRSAPSHPALIDLTQQIKSKSRWDVALDKLIALNPKAEAAATPAAITESKPIRLIWELDTDFGYRLHPREQKQTKSGWSKGRHVALKRLCEEPDQFTYMSESDKTVCRAIEKRQGWGYYAKTEYSLEGLRALEAAAGIDNLYHLGEFDTPIDLVRREPELMVSQQGEELCLSIAEFSDDFIEEAADGFSERPTRHRGRAAYSLRSISDSRYQLTVFSPEHLKVGEIIGETGLLIPISAKQKALDGISAIAPFLNIQSDIAELDTGLATVECDNHLVVNIQPTQHGLAFTCVVMPFGEAGPAYTPGLGNASLSAEIKGKRLATQRDLLREEDLLDQLDEHCPAFLAMSGNSLVLEDFQASLAALEQLESAFNQSAFELMLRWPKGKKISLTKKLGSEQLQLALGKQNEWFDISGNLAINDEEVIELRKLLGLLSSSNGRFIELGKDQILALSDELRQKLELINQVSDEGKFHPLASLQIEQAVSGMRMKTLHAWDQQTLKMREANSLRPKLPSTFQAQLRDYQLVGFDWASRLAHWGAGACLADDMGLGKTLQALAVILSRAQDGPSLVIAPTSVCFNWHQEAVKFSPTLNIKLFADSVTTLERGELLKTLQPFDCVIISYGLLQRESELLAQVQWRTIVADEAQALKNPTAKRTKAAYALKGDFKMITTGTPIENDLTELWSLFRFINPGLLGNLKRFAQRFAIPIENAKDNKLEAHKAQQGLKTLIQPFMLRRMKNQVLTELPPRTEINIQVEMAPREKAFYEALRLNAIDNITQSSTSNAGEQRIKMLAELVKLRQACCNSKLVMAESDIPSAKLAALDELLEELKLNNHKALIFSQFVGHLQLIKQHLERKGFSYQYLDGSTPQKERQKRVNAFQSGEGDVFLISLKAGGSGLNLTAADYVIHMDPWWNPAVEEQASDRAHRMGQTRPVTIYRLITQHTIEEKIVALHQHKRDLADKLLSGNETVNKLSVEDMLNLLKDTF